MFKNPSNFFQQVLSSSVYTKPIKSGEPPFPQGGVPKFKIQTIPVHTFDTVPCYLSF